MDPIDFEKQYPDGRRLEIAVGDLTRQDVDAIVNAANSRLAHGGGVAGTIVRRGGEIIQRESDNWVRINGPVSHDRPAFTAAGSLPCRYVIHAVGPVWGEGGEEAKLAAAVRGSLELAESLKLTSIAFPAISTGIFGFPLQLAAEVFARTIDTFLVQKNPANHLKLVRLVLLDQATSQVFIDAFNKL